MLILLQEPCCGVKLSLPETLSDFLPRHQPIDLKLAKPSGLVLLPSFFHFTLTKKVFTAENEDLLREEEEKVTSEKLSFLSLASRPILPFLFYLTFFGDGFFTIFSLKRNYIIRSTAIAEEKKAIAKKQVFSRQKANLKYFLYPFSLSPPFLHSRIVNDTGQKKAAVKFFCLIF